MEQLINRIRNYCIYNFIDVLLLIFNLTINKGNLWYKYLIGLALAGIVLNTIGILLNLSIVKKVKKLERR